MWNPVSFLRLLKIGVIAIVVCVMVVLTGCKGSLVCDSDRCVIEIPLDKEHK